MTSTMVDQNSSASQPSPGSNPAHAGIDVAAESRAAMADLLDRFAWLTVTFGTLATAASVARIFTTGWVLNIGIDIAVFTGMMVVVLLRKTMPGRLVLILLLALVSLSSLANFLTMGIVTVSFVLMATVIVCSSIAFGTRVGVWFLGVAAVAVMLIHAAFASGVIEHVQLPPGYLHSASTWLSQTLGFVAYTAAILAVVDSSRRRLTRSFGRIAEQAHELRESEEMHRLLAENMRDVLFKQDMALAITYLSPSVERVFGYSVEEMSALTMKDLMTPDSFAKAKRTFGEYARRASEGLVRVPPLEFECVRRDGSTFWGEMRASFLHDDDGKPTGVQGIVIDITSRREEETKRRELEDQLRQAEKLQALGQLAGGIAHDFNNQLVGVIAYADLLKLERPNDPTVVEYAENMLVPARRAAELTAKLLAFGRKGQVQRAHTDMHEVINEVVGILGRSIDRNIRLVRHYEANVSTVDGDASQLQNALLNIGLNARDAMPEGGEIEFKTAVVGTPDGLQAQGVGERQWFEVTVRDTGAGMAPEVSRRIFEPFFTTKDAGQGTGMGLAAVHGTITSHEGHIRVNTAPGEGTTFTLLFPLSTSPADDAPRQAGDRGLVKGKGQVLVVDDEGTVRAALSRVLTHVGYDVHSCASGREAIAWFRDHGDRVDLVLLDLVLPEMRGTAVLEELRRMRADVCVIIISGYTADQDVRSLMEAGAVDFLKKPFTNAELTEATARALGRSTEHHG